MLIMLGVYLLLVAIISRASSKGSLDPFFMPPPCDTPLVLPYSKSDPDPSYLLPTALRPTHYDLTLEPHLPPKGNFSFSGHVNITMRCDEDTNNITLHIWNISIFEETVLVWKMLDGSTIEHTSFTYDTHKEQVVIRLGQELKALEDYAVSIDFLGFLSTQLEGFYRSSYTDKQFNTRWLVTTQFEPTGARKAFPCFDEPSYKATFTITIVRPTNMVALSNMPVANTTHKGHLSVDIFETTLPMSTYIIAFVVCDFSFRASRAGRVPFRVWSTPQTIDQIEYALEVGPKASNFFEIYFNISYPLPKQDMIYIPDFKAGAMENWGLITYSQNALLFSENVTNDETKHQVLTTICHELAHQWFGNLVTPKWWNDIWLNEGFATYFEYIAADYVEPTWELLSSHSYSELYLVLDSDADNTHPVSVTVNTPSEIQQIFDPISYGKGSVMIRMMHGFLGKNVCYEGIRNFLITFRYKNAMQDDLWYCLSEALKKFGKTYVDVKAVMDVWTRTIGYPVIKIERDYENHTCNLTQKRFDAFENEGNSSTDELSLDIALNITTYLIHEREYLPWRSAFQNIIYVRNMIRKSPIYQNYKVYLLKLLKPIYQYLGYFDRKGDTHTMRLLRNAMLERACMMGHKECIEISVRLYESWKADPIKNPLKPNYRNIVLIHGVKKGKKSHWKYAYEQYLVSDNDEERKDFLKALASSEDKKILKHFFEMVLDPNTTVKEQDFIIAFLTLMETDEGYEFALDFLRENHEEIRKFLSMNNALKIIKNLAKYVNTAEELNMATIVIRAPIIRSLAPIFIPPSCDIPLILPYSESDPSPMYLLPTALRPTHYDLRLEPHLPPRGNFSFSGHVNISMRCDENTRNITLNVLNISIFEETVRVRKVVDGSTIGHIMFTYDIEQQRVTIHLKQELEALEDYSVSMEFLGYLNDEMTGFYRSSYKDAQGNVRWLATTHFEPIGARRAFPCFDEPIYRATFAITIIRPTNMISLSNMPISETVSRGNVSVDIYETTVLMPSYLVAYVVCDFTFTSSGATHTLFRIWSRPSAMDQVGYAVEVGPKTSSFIEKYFNVAFPLPKQDMIAIPDFPAGAMENWGLITYKETSLLCKQNVSSNVSKQRVLSVISHEIAHQWFGNLVTLKWWNDIWLNEGFASYMQFILSDNVEPTWEQIDTLYLTERFYRALQDDSSPASHPVSVTANSANEINAVFDSMSYGKGSAIIRMMHHFLGDKVFREGLKNYLLKLSYKNAMQDDLWHYLSKASKKSGKNYVNLKVIMDSWTRITGHPVVNVERNYRNHSCSLTQKRFITIESSKINPTEGRLWHIPISFTTSLEKDFANTTPSFWFSNTSDSMIIGINAGVPTSDHAWMLFNIKHTVFCRINYDIDNWKLILRQLLTNHKAIHSINRAQIISDALNLARAKELDYKMALNLTTYLIHEREYLPWHEAFRAFSHINSMMRNTSSYPIFKRYLLKILAPVYQHLSYYERISDKHTKRLLRIEILQWACRMEHSECLQTSLKLFESWMSNPVSNTIPPNLKAVVITYGVHEGNESHWNFVFQQYQTTNIATDKAEFLSALAASKDSNVLGRFMEIALDPHGGIPEWEFSTVFKSLLRTTEGHIFAFNFLKEKWEYVKNMLSKSKIRGLLQTLLNAASTIEELHQINSISVAVFGEKVTLNPSYVNSNIKWVEENFFNVKTFLEEQ